MRNLLKTLVASAGLVAACVTHAQPDTYPSKPIRLIVGFPPGGPTDIAGRVIALHLGKELKTPVIVENKGGAGGAIGAREVAKSKPDGYTLLVAVESSNTRGAALSELPYDPLKDFTYIRKVDKQRNLVAVNPAFPAKDMKELVAYIKANPGKVDFAGTFGASSHTGGVLFGMLNKLDMQFVNYQGGSQPINDVVAGQVPLGFFTESTIAQFVKAGKLRALAIAADVKSPAFPDLPTIAETGLPAMDISAWQALAGPAGLPADVTKKISDAVARMVEDKEFLAQLETIGASPIRDSSPEKFTREIADETKFWKKFVVDAKIQVSK